MKPSSEIVHSVKLPNSKILWMNELKDLVVNSFFYLKILLFLSLSHFLPMSFWLAFFSLFVYCSCPFFLSFSPSLSNKPFFFYIIIPDFELLNIIKYFFLIQARLSSILFFWDFDMSEKTIRIFFLVNWFSYSVLKYFFPVLHQLMRRLFINLYPFMPMLGLRSFFKITLVLTS